jgi:hypothetical protein
LCLEVIKVIQRPELSPLCPLAAFPVRNYCILNSFSHFFNYICQTIELAWFGGSLNRSEERRENLFILLELVNHIEADKLNEQFM